MQVRGIRQRLAEKVARRLWPFLEPHAKRAILGYHVKTNAPPHLVRASEPTYANLAVVETALGEGEPVVVGRYCSLNFNAFAFLGGMHNTDMVSTFHFHRVMGLPGELEPPLSHGPIVIGNDVWISFDALVMSGVTVGDGAVVAARAVVTKDVAPYEIVGGVPARHIGWRFDEATREALLRIRWWDWPVETVVERLAEIQSTDVAAFVAKYDPAGS